MRWLNRIATALLAVALLVGGPVLVVEGVLAALGHPGPFLPRWSATLTRTRWQDGSVRAVALTITLLGLLLLVAELRRWRPTRLRLTAEDGWHLHRRSLERRLARAVRAVPSIRRARVRIRRRGDNWRPRITATGDPAARADVEFAVHRELDRLAAPRPGRIEVRLLPVRRSP